MKLISFAIISVVAVVVVLPMIQVHGAEPILPNTIVFGLNGGNTDGESEKVTICHVPPGNPDGGKTISVDLESAVEHLSEHEHDYEGECVGS